jgi:hypothetical protein
MTHHPRTAHVLRALYAALRASFRHVQSDTTTISMEVTPDTVPQQEFATMCVARTAPVALRSRRCTTWRNV